MTVSHNNSSTYSNNEYLTPEPPCESKAPGMAMRASTIASGIDINIRKLPTVFRWTGSGENVFVSTSYDNWASKLPLVRSRHDLYTIVDLPEGTHQYKFYVDDQWVCDDNAEKVDNSFGTCNNVLSVKASDFEVFEALSIDSANSAHDSRRRRCGSPPGDYGQVVPSRSDSKHGVRRSAPPILPQHLLQMILNKEVAVHCEPGLLHEPTHVMLNHLYALSIKDGMMIVSSTVRYRKKFITTLYYKPCPQ